MNTVIKADFQILNDKDLTEWVVSFMPTVAPEWCHHSQANDKWYAVTVRQPPNTSIHFKTTTDRPSNSRALKIFAEAMEEKEEQERNKS